jgi:hypothetical protein
LLPAGPALVVLLVVLPGLAAARSLDPSVVVDTPWLRAVVSFLLVLSFGGAVLVRYDELVDRSIDVSMERPLVSTVYGVVAHLVIAFAAGVFSTQLANAGVDQSILSVSSSAVLGAIMLGLAGLGFTVVGTWLTELRGERRPWNGLAVGAAIGAVGLLVLPLPAGLLVWVLVVSIGIGGPTRKWVHEDRSIETETGD